MLISLVAEPTRCNNQLATRKLPENNRLRRLNGKQGTFAANEGLLPGRVAAALRENLV